jgi:hypothetical protein
MVLGKPLTDCWAMAFKPLSIILACFVLAGCSATTVPLQNASRWDGRIDHEKRKFRKAAPLVKAASVETEVSDDDITTGSIHIRQKRLSSLTPYSKEWFAAQQAIDEAEEKRLKANMSICRRC